MDVEQTCVHEGAHLVCGRALEFEPVRALITRDERPGSLSGCAWWVAWEIPAEDVADFDPSLPWIGQPVSLRERVEREAVAVLSGDVAEALLRPKWGRVAEPVHVQAVETVAGLDDDARLAAAVRADPPATDAARVAELAFLAHGKDNPDEMMAWLGWLRAATRTLVLARADEIERVAAALARAPGGVLAGEALAAAFGDGAGAPGG